MCRRVSQHGDGPQERDDSGRIRIGRVAALAVRLRVRRTVHRTLSVRTVHACAADRIGGVGTGGDE